jgi:hypothetical protein
MIMRQYPYGANFRARTYYLLDHGPAQALGRCCFFPRRAYDVELNRDVLGWRSMKCPSCNRMLLDSASFCPYCGETDVRGKPARPVAPKVAQPEDSGSTMVMQVTPEMLRAETFEPSKPAAPSAPPSPAPASGGTKIGIGLPPELSQPLASGPKKTIAGLGLADILKAQAQQQQAASASAVLPMPKVAPAASTGPKKTLMGLGIQDILSQNQKAAASVLGDAPARQEPVQAAAAPQPTRAPTPPSGTPGKPTVVPAPHQEAEPFKEESTIQRVPGSEFRQADEEALKLVHELPTLEEDVETLQFLPPMGGLFSLFGYARHAGDLRQRITALREVLKERRQILTRHKKQAYQELGRLGWLKGIRIVGLDSYVSELAFYRDQVTGLQKQKDEARARLASETGVARPEEEVRKLRYLDFELHREDLWQEETRALEFRIANLNREVEYLRDVAGRVPRQETRANLENLLRDRSFVLQNAEAKRKEVQELRRAHAEKQDMFRRERERVAERCASYLEESAAALAQLDKDERAILDKIAPSLEKMGEIIAASQSLKGEAHQDLKDWIEVVQRVEEWLTRENLDLVKLKEVEGRIDPRRVTQANVFLVSLVVLGVGFTSMATLIVLWLLGVV